jgi:hypothetical protein
MTPRQRRVAMIRNRVVGSALALFVALFMVITVRLASGHDPALVKSATASSASGDGTVVASTSGSGASPSVADDGYYSGDGSYYAPGDSSAVTTRQS